MGYTLFQSGYNSSTSNYGDGRKFKPQGTWNLYWCSHQGSHMWCDCKMKDAWKNSTVSNPKYYTGLVLREFPANPCGCHRTHGYTGSCILANYGEMESVTCNLCTPQDQHWTCA